MWLPECDRAASTAVNYIALNHPQANKLSRAQLEPSRIIDKYMKSGKMGIYLDCYLPN
ncbi:hypothetical protein [Microcoleus sp. A006_D1]|uniref:hypothetical protein n=1 Tax=Microcoleus sp. A006_D1 TaxID=3055267 RepID=UPI002FD6A1EF